MDDRDDEGQMQFRWSNSFCILQVCMSIELNAEHLVMPEIALAICKGIDSAQQFLL